jgi:hypothetical protein
MTQRKASLKQVVLTIVFGLFAIGKKNTWQKDGATITLKQAVIGALVGGVVLVSLLILLVNLVTR